MRQLNPSTSSSLPVVFILGPTASGKTSLASELLQLCACTLISVDSTQVYRGMDIGSAKPSPAELSRAPHELIDIREPWQTYSAAEFCSDATALIAAARAGGKVPVLVGGTMMYYRALEEGLADMPAASAEIRAQIASDAEQRGWASVHAQLAAVDPEAAKRIHPNDPQRVQRALEVYLLTGEPISQRQGQTGSGHIEGRLLKFGLYPQDRAELHQAIGIRFDSMLEAGLIEEVESLAAREQITQSLPSQRAVGYRQVWELLCGQISRQDLADKGKAATRQLAKRQLTWMRGMDDLVLTDSQKNNAPDIARWIVEAVNPELLD